MESNKRELEMKLNQEGYTYVFETKQEMGAKPPSKFRRKIWQVVPSICASLICLPYGIMLGWPSPTYPNLIKPDSPIVIDMDQSAMIAGFLMIGNIVGTPFSSFRGFGSKYGLTFGSAVMTIGWIIMWHARDIYWLLSSRFIIGLGNGFVFGQLKLYLTEICQDSLAKFLVKFINLYTFFGVCLAFLYGPWVNFSHFSVIATIISILVLFIAIFLPSTPRELVKNGKLKEAKKLIAFLSPELDLSEEMKKVKERVNNLDKDFSVCDILKNSSLRRNFIILAFAVFFQQFSGIPSTIIYCQMIFMKSGCPRPELCAIIYSFTYFLANVYGIFCVSDQNKKHFLLFSSIGTSILILVKIIILVENVNNFWSFTSLLILLLYNIVHTVGLGNVPFKLIPDLFPKEANKVVFKFFVILHTTLAIIITKIFQVMFTQIGLYAPFCLFLVVSTFSIIFVIVFVPKNYKANAST